MMIDKYRIFWYLKFIFILLSVAQLSLAQIDDPCGWMSVGKAHTVAQFHGWGYPFDSLLTDLQRWDESPFVEIDSIGASVQNRKLWLLTIQDTSDEYTPRWRIMIHARTHPGEVQSTWVTNEIIKILLGESMLARNLRRDCIFNILPMYNPDGVELGYGRVNANEIDLERNWDDEIQEPEAAALKQLFETYMGSENPIRIALNMHSAFNCKRFFVYHHENGTSVQFAEDEKKFIGDVRMNWPEGIEDWNYFVSWTNGTPPYYPESWFWINFGEQVMALTYEDMNCAEAADFDKTASALLEGMWNYLNTTTSIVYETNAREQDNESLRIYPNPVRSNSRVSVSFAASGLNKTQFILYNILGQRLRQWNQEKALMRPVTVSLKIPDLPAGIYYLTIISADIPKTLPIYVIR